jgi:antitoxin YefM
LYKKSDINCTNIYPMKSLTISTFRKDLKRHSDYVSDNGEIIVAPRTNEDDAVVIMSIKEYNALKETEHLLSTKTNRKKLQDSIEERPSGKTKKLAHKLITQ